MNCTGYICKKSNNIGEVSVVDIDKESNFEYNNPKEFHNWILSLKPKDVRDEGISEKGLRDFQAENKTREGI